MLNAITIIIQFTTFSVQIVASIDTPYLLVRV